MAPAAVRGRKMRNPGHSPSTGAPGVMRTPDPMFSLGRLRSMFSGILGDGSGRQMRNPGHSPSTGAPEGDAGA